MHVGHHEKSLLHKHDLTANWNGTTALHTIFDEEFHDKSFRCSEAS
jgi:hypothetical protein